LVYTSQRSLRIPYKDKPVKDAEEIMAVLCESYTRRIALCGHIHSFYVYSMWYVYWPLCFTGL